MTSRNTTQEIRIRPADHRDVALLCALGRKTFSDTFESFNTAEDMKLYLEKNFSEEQLEKEMQEAGAVFFLAWDDEKAVGYAKVRKGDAPPELLHMKAFEIERVYADREYLGKHVGKSLLTACMDHARQTGYDTVWLGVWEHNPRAIAFYEKWGFEKFGEHEFVLGTDVQTDWLMMKKI